MIKMAFNNCQEFTISASKLCCHKDSPVNLQLSSVMQFSDAVQLSELAVQFSELVWLSVKATSFVSPFPSIQHNFECS